MTLPFYFLNFTSIKKVESLLFFSKSTTNLTYKFYGDINLSQKNTVYNYLRQTTYKTGKILYFQYFNLNLKKLITLNTQRFNMDNQSLIDIITIVLTKAISSNL
jgi:hypothetical protein